MTFNEFIGNSFNMRALAEALAECRRDLIYPDTDEFIKISRCYKVPEHFLKIAWDMNTYNNFPLAIRSLNIPDNDKSGKGETITFDRKNLMPPKKLVSPLGNILNYDEPTIDKKLLKILMYLSEEQKDALYYFLLNFNDIDDSYFG